MRAPNRFRLAPANVVVGWLAGVLAFYNSTFYWYFHSWHHRYTQDPARDPGIALPEIGSRLAYLAGNFGRQFLVAAGVDYPRLALGLARGLPFVPEGRGARSRCR